MNLTAVSLAALLVLGGCTLTPEQAAWNRAHHVGELPLTPADAPFNGKNYADPSPHSDSDDQQRAAYEANQQRQMEIKRGEDVENEEARKAGFGPSPTDGMNCASTSSFSGSANNGTSTSHTSCHN